MAGGAYGAFGLRGEMAVALVLVLLPRPAAPHATVQHMMGHSYRAQRIELARVTSSNSRTDTPHNIPILHRMFCNVCCC